jgi:transposase
MALKTLLKSILNVNGIKINDVNFHHETSEVAIHVESTKGQKRRCPICAKKGKGYDRITTQSKWRGLDFGSCKVFLIADVHRVECKDHGVHTEKVPWAYHHSNFTKEFEAQVAYLAIHLNRTEVSKLMRISWHTVGPILTRIKNKLEPDSTIRYANLKRIGIDETSYRKGHNYVTVVIDHDTNQVIWIGKGTGIVVLEAFMKSLSQAQRDNIELVSADGAKRIKSCLEKWLPNSDFCIDAFHVVSWAIEAMDENRKEFWRAEFANFKTKKKELPPRSQGRPKLGKGVPSKSKVQELKRAKYALGKNPENLSGYQTSCLNQIRTLYPKLFKAYQLKEGLRAVFRSKPQEVEIELKRWLAWACRCRIPAFVELSKRIRRHYTSIVNTVNHNLSNARLEAMNNKIKVMIRKAYGFRNIQNMMDTIMIVCSNLVHQIKLPHQTRISTHTY